MNRTGKKCVQGFNGATSRKQTASNGWACNVKMELK